MTNKVISQPLEAFDKADEQTSDRQLRFSLAIVSSNLSLHED